MGDDIKNLFQKFGKSDEAYKEINRAEAGEEARRRWPLLRDVHIQPAAGVVEAAHGMPASGILSPKPSESRAMPMVAPVAESPVEVKAPTAQSVVPAFASQLMKPHDAPAPAAPVPTFVPVHTPAAQVVKDEPQSLQALFNRLSGKPTRAAEPTQNPNAFFQKLFKP